MAKLPHKTARAPKHGPAVGTRMTSATKPLYSPPGKRSVAVDGKAVK